MRKFTLALSLVAGITVAAQAQTNVRLGIKAGATLSTATGSAISNAKYKFGGNVGLILNAKVSDNVAFQPELLYSMKGFKGESSGTQVIGNNTYSYSRKASVTLHYLDIPLVIKINASDLFFEAGPQLGFLVGQRSTYDVSYTVRGGTLGGTSFSDSGSSSSTDGLRKVDVGYILGVGYQLTPDVSLGVRYNGGITSLDKDSDAKVRNGAFQLQLGYLFAGR